MRVIFTVIVTLIVVAVLGAGFIYSGMCDVAAGASRQPAGRATDPRGVGPLDRDAQGRGGGAGGL